MAGSPDNGKIDTRTVEEIPEWKLAGRYTFLRILGKGGSGHVYLADDRMLSRQVAVKTIRSSLCGNQEVRRRIERECRLHAAIGIHPNIVALHDRIEENGRIYLVMEYVDGQTLAGLLASCSFASRSELALQDVLAIVSQILEALACIHGHGIIHRDIKTSNIIVRRCEQGGYIAKLMDFGIARQEDATEQATMLTREESRGPGTPAYMAPERIDAQTYGDTCPATDLYSVGIILYELLSGKPPFRGSITEIFTGHLTRRPDLSRLRADVPPALREVVGRALEKEPGQRYTEARALQSALAGAAGERPEQEREQGGSAAARTLLHCAAGDDTGKQGDGTLLDCATAGFSAVRKWRRSRWYVLVVVLAGLLVLATTLGLHRMFSQSDEVQTAGPATDRAPEVKVAGRQAAEGTDEERQTGASALKVLEERRNNQAEDTLPSTVNQERNGNRETESAWEIIEVHDRKIR